MEAEGEEDDPESIVESQMEIAVEEWSMYNDLQVTLAQFDDRNTSLQGIQKEAEEAVLQCLNSHDCELSQSIEAVDVEQIITTYLFDTGRKNKFNQIDFDTFLDNRASVVSINCKSNIAAPVAPIRNRNFLTAFPMPFMVVDVLRIETNGQVWQEVNLFNQKFKFVMIYGHVRQDIGSGKAKARKNGLYDENKKRYIIDDGTAKIKIMYTHKTAKYSELMKSISQLDCDFEAARRHGIPQLEGNFSPKTDVCKKVLESVGILMRRIRVASHIPQRYYEVGTKAFVVGAPYRRFPGDSVHLYATEMCEDKGLDRINEINFKRKLADLYNNVYAF